MKYYKTLNKDGYAYIFGEQMKWPLPEKQRDGSWKPGEWTSMIENLCLEEDLIYFLDDLIYEVECRGPRLGDEDEIIVEQARLIRKYENWNERTARLFACWCVRNTPLIGGRTVWDLLADSRSRTAVEVAERYANGDVTKEELDAARVDAWTAAETISTAALESAMRDAETKSGITPDIFTSTFRSRKEIESTAVMRANERAAIQTAAWAAVYAVMDYEICGITSSDVVHATIDVAIYDAWIAGISMGTVAQDAQTKELLRILNEEVK
jgi:hypothetical protein